jgi:hypothetical protein
VISKILFGCFAFASLCLPSLAQDADQMIEEAVLHCAKLSENYSVIGCFEMLSTKESHSNGGRLEGELEISQKLFRIVRSTKTNSVRFDLQSSSDRSDSKTFEHSLVKNGATRVAWGSEPAKFNPDGTPRVKSLNAMNKFDFPGAPLTSLFGPLTGTNSYTRDFGKYELIHDEVDTNGFRVLWFTMTERKYCVRLRWERLSIPVEMEWFEAPKGVVLNKEVQMKRSYTKWSQCHSTRSIFRDSKKHGPVPISVSYEYSASLGTPAEAELRFLDWRFGDEVDETLLDEDRFDRNGVLATIDFDDWSDRFDRWNLRREMENKD